MQLRAEPFRQCARIADGLFRVALKSVGASTLLISITQRAPRAGCLALLADQASKPLAQVPGDRSRPARAQRASVALDHGN